MIPALAIRVAGGPEDRLIWSAGFGPEPPLVILVFLTRMECQWDPHSWGSPARTMRAAHLHIQQEWDRLPDGAVVDVEYVLGETSVCKESEVGR